MRRQLPRLLTLLVLPVLYAAFGSGQQGLTAVAPPGGSNGEEKAHVAP